MTPRPVINFIRQTGQRHTTDRQNFYCSFLVLGVQNLQKKKFQLNQKKKKFQDCSNICPPGLWTYKKTKRSLLQYMSCSIRKSGHLKSNEHLPYVLHTHHQQHLSSTPTTPKSPFTPPIFTSHLWQPAAAPQAPAGHRGIRPGRECQ